MLKSATFSGRVVYKCHPISLLLRSHDLVVSTGKGTATETYTQCVMNFHQVGVAVSINSFTHFPTERFEQALDTLQFLSAHKPMLSLIGCWWFGLYKGSYIYHHPAQFNISAIVDLGGSLEVQFTLNQKQISREQNTELRRIKRELINGDVFPYAGYPQGLHSQLYFLRHGVHVFDQVKENLVDNLGTESMDE